MGKGVIPEITDWGGSGRNYIQKKGDICGHGPRTSCRPGLGQVLALPLISCSWKGLYNVAGKSQALETDAVTKPKFLCPML